MHHAVRVFGTAQRHVPILSAIHLGIEAANLLQQRAPNDTVHEHIGAQQNVGRPLGLEPGRRAPQTVGGNFVLVKIDNIYGAIISGLADSHRTVQALRHVIERVDGPQIVMIQQGYKFALGDFERGIGIIGDPQVFWQVDSSNARIAGGTMVN